MLYYEFRWANSCMSLKMESDDDRGLIPKSCKVEDTNLVGKDAGVEEAVCAGACGGYNAVSSVNTPTCGGNPLLVNIAVADSLHGTYQASSGDEPSTESRMCTEESVERMTSSTEGMLSLSEDSSGRDTYAQAHEVAHWSSMSAYHPGIYAIHRVPSLDFDVSDEQINGVLGSYREILVEDEVEGDACDRNALIGEDTEEEVSNLTPDSGPTSPLEVDLDMEEPELAHLGNKRPNSLRLSYSEAVHSRSCSNGGRIIVGAHGLVSSAPSSSSQQSSVSQDKSVSGLEELAGVMSRDGEMLSFVAQNLQEQIKRASPVVKRGDTPSFPLSRSSTPGLYKATVPNPQLQPVDSNMLQDIESKARIIATSVDTILENLTGTLHSMSSLTVDCVDIYEEVVDKTCDSIDENIKGMYQLMAKSEELGNLMRPVYRLSGHIKEIKRMLDLFEQVVISGSN